MEGNKVVIGRTPTVPPTRENSAEGQYYWSTRGFLYTVSLSVCTVLYSVLDQIGYTEVTSVYSGEHVAIGVHFELAV